MTAASPHARAATKPARCGARGQAQIAVALTVLIMFYKLVVIAVSVRLQLVFIAWKEQASEAGHPAAAASCLDVVWRGSGVAASVRAATMASSRGPARNVSQRAVGAER